MNKIKLSLAAIAFVAAAGVAGAGSIVINGEAAGSYNTMTLDSAGTINLTGAIVYDSSSTEVCTTDASEAAGCQPPPVADCAGDTDTSLPGCQSTADTTDPGGTGDTGGTGVTGCTDFTSPFPGEVTTVAHFLTQLSGGVERLKVPTGEYLAISFEAPQANLGTTLSFDIGTRAAFSVGTYAISSCPGDFAQHLPSNHCRAQDWTLNNFYLTTVPTGVSCELTPGEIYYLNIYYGDGPGNNLINRCTSSACGADFAWYDISYLL